MTIEEKLRLYILNKYCTMAKFSDEVGISPATLSAIFKRGLKNCSASNLFKICEALGISLDALQEGEIVPKEKNLSLADIKQAMTMLARAHKLAVDNEPLTPMEYTIFVNNMELTCEIIKQNRSFAKQNELPETGSAENDK